MSLRLRGAGFNFLVAVCVAGPLPWLQGVLWPLAGVRRAGAASSGVCGGLLGLDPWLVSLALVSCGVLWCAVLCPAVFRCAASCLSVLCCGAPCFVVLCCAVACHGVSRCAASRGVMLLCVMSWGALSWCVARQCAAVRCAVLPRVVPWWGRGLGSVVVRVACVVVQEAG